MKIDVLVRVGRYDSCAPAWSSVPEASPNRRPATPGLLYRARPPSEHNIGHAALLIEADPTATAQQVRDALVGGAFDIEVAGADRDSGEGLVDAHDAGQFITQCRRRMRLIVIQETADALPKHALILQGANPSA